MKASVATTAGLSAQRSTEGLSLEEGEVVQFCKYYPLRFARPPNLGGQYRGLDNIYIITKKISNNIAVVQRSFLSALSVILTERSVGRIPRSDLARDHVRCFTSFSMTLSR